MSVWGDGKLIGTLVPDHFDYPANHPAGSLFRQQNLGPLTFTILVSASTTGTRAASTSTSTYDDLALDTRRIGCL
jgi:hypothetical protein